MKRLFRVLWKLFANAILKSINSGLAAFHAVSRYLKTHKRIRFILISLLTAGIIAGSGYEGWRRWKAARDHDEEHEAELIHRTEEDLAKYGVQFADAGPGKLAIELKAPGEIKLNGDMLAHMIPRFPGVVRQVMKNLGDQVKKGDVLAIFENTANMATFEMRSQLDGVIIEKSLAVGEVIGSGEEAFAVADLSQVWVDLFIYPADLPKVKAGQKVRVLDQTSGHSAEGTLAYVAPTISDHTRTALARVILANAELLWRPGTFVTGAILIDESDVPILVDAEAVEDIAGVTTVFVKENDAFAATPVRVGRHDDKNVEILEGISAGSRVSTTGSFLLKSELAKGSMSGHEH